MTGKKTILVTGGAGFIGSHLCEFLLKNKNNYVICLDNLITGSLENIKSLFSYSNFEFIKHDIIYPYHRNYIDEIYNLACPASPVQYQKNPIKTIKTCTIGVINMLGLAKQNNAKILQASTSEIYGDPIVHPQNETYNGNVNPVGIRSCYDEGKRCAESLFMDYNREHNLKIKIIRIFNTYGPKMNPDDGRVVSNFINQSINLKNITIYGSGEQTRSFLYINDLVDGLVKLMKTDDKVTGPVNIGNIDEITIFTLAEKILRLSKSNSKLIFKKLPDDDPRMRKPDISLLNKLIDWEGKTNINEGLLITINYFKKLQNSKVK